MKPRFPTRNFQRGAVAVELALAVLVFVVLLIATLAAGRLFWHYTVAHKAAQDAARYLSTISAQEMRDPDLALAAVSLTKEIAHTELADINPGREKPEVDVLCGDANCTGVRSRPLPRNIKVIVWLYFDDVFGFFDFGRYGLPIEAVAEMRYVGN